MRDHDGIGAIGDCDAERLGRQDEPAGIFSRVDPRTECARAGTVPGLPAIELEGLLSPGTIVVDVEKCQRTIAAHGYEESGAGGISGSAVHAVGRPPGDDVGRRLASHDDVARKRTYRGCVSEN